MLESITIPESVTSIGSLALNGCRWLKFITSQGTIAQWEEIARRLRENVHSLIGISNNKKPLDVWAIVYEKCTFQKQDS